MSMNPYDGPEQRQGMSGATKVILGLLIGFVVLGVICCGGFGLIGYWGYSMMADAFSKDPAVVGRVQGEIVDIEVPEQFKAEGSMDMKFPFNQGAMQMVIYSGPEVEGSLLMFQFSSPKLAEDPNTRQQFDQAFHQQHGKQEAVTVTKSEPFKTTINGEETTFVIGEGTTHNSEDLHWRVTGDFKGKAGPAKMEMQALQDKISKDEIMTMLKSMK